jgi:hypothetical protein
MPGCALDLHRAADTAYPFTDRAQAHSMFYIHIKSASIIRYGQLYRIDIVHQRHIHTPGVTMPRHIGKRFLCDAIECLLYLKGQPVFVACDQLNVGVVAIFPFEDIFTQSRDKSLFLKRDGIDLLNEER